MLEITTSNGNIVVPEDVLPLAWYGDQKEETFNFYKKYLYFLEKDEGRVIVDWKKEKK